MNNKRSQTLKQSKYHSDFMTSFTLAQSEMSGNILITSISSATTASSNNHSFLQSSFYLNVSMTFTQQSKTNGASVNKDGQRSKCKAAEAKDVSVCCSALNPVCSATTASVNQHRTSLLKACLKGENKSLSETMDFYPYKHSYPQISYRSEIQKNP